MLARIASVVLFLLAAAFAFGWLVDANAVRAAGLAYLGAFAFVLSCLPQRPSAP